MDSKTRFAVLLGQPTLRRMIKQITAICVPKPTTLTDPSRRHQADPACPRLRTAVIFRNDLRVVLRGVGE
jgi:hypothetical protein